MLWRRFWRYWVFPDMIPRLMALQRIAVGLCLLSLPPAVFGTAPDAFPTSESLRHIRGLDEPRLSPDGRHVLFRSIDATADGARGHLYWVAVDGGAPQPLTSTPANDLRGEHDAVWTADGSAILFLAKRGDREMLYRLSMQGGDALPVPVSVPVQVDQSRDVDAIPALVQGTAQDATVRLPVDVMAFRVAPGSDRIAMLARDPQTPGEKALVDGKADATAVDQDPHRTRLYVLDGASGTPVVQQVNLAGACADCDVADFDWSPDGARWVVVLKHPGHRDDLGPSAGTWIIDGSGVTAPRHLDAVPATVSIVRWSADGQQILYVAQSRADAPPGYSSLYAFDLRQGTVHRWLEAEPMPISAPVSLADGSILVSAQQGLDQPLLRYTFEQAAAHTWALPVASVVSWDANASGIVFVGSAGGSPPALYFATAFGQSVRRLASAAVLPPGTRTVAAQRLEWVHEHRVLQGLLYLPPAQGTQQSVPLIVEVHGGPLGAYTDRYDPFVDFLIGQGWAVLRTNPRGSTGRGPEFAAANHNDLGGGDFRDVMSGVDWALAHAPVDRARLALMGYSYGGEMAGFAEGRTTRFRAIVSGAPVIDQFSEYGTEDSSWYDRWYFGKPWEHMADAWRQSPLAGVANAHTPFLLLQGEADLTDPLGQSQEMYRALRQMGVPVQLITYPREDHGPLARGLYGEPSPEPWHGLDARRRVVDFIRHAFEGSER